MQLALSYNAGGSINEYNHLGKLFGIICGSILNTYLPYDQTILIPNINEYSGPSKDIYKTVHGSFI